MRRILDIRIVRWQLKLLFVVGAVLIGFPIAALLDVVGSTALAIGLVNTVVEMAALLLGARIFRGQGEAIEPPRPWWRMTARPTLSRRLGILFIVLAVLLMAGLIVTVAGLTSTGWTVTTLTLGIAGVIQFGVIAGLYLNSAVRLQRRGVPPREPKFKPTLRIAP